MSRTIMQRICFATALGAVMAAQGWAAPADVARGRAIAEARCARCHAIGRDDAAKHPEAPNFRDLHRRWPVEMMQEALAEGIMTGHPDMPEARFEADEIDAFLAYLDSLAAPQAPVSR